MFLILAIKYNYFFTLLKIFDRAPFLYVSNKQNKDFNLDSFEILNSNNVLNQFIIYHIFYLTEESLENFLKKIDSNMEGGDPEENEFETYTKVFV